MAANFHRQTIAAVLLVAFFSVGVSALGPDPEAVKEAKGTDGTSPPVTLSVPPDTLSVQAQAVHHGNHGHHRRHGPKSKKEASPVAVMDNGIVQVTFLIPEGNVVGIKYGGIDNLLDFTLRSRGYWDSVLSGRSVNHTSNYWTFDGEKFHVIKNDSNHIEISFTSFQHELAIDKRFVMLRGVSGFYSYAVVKHEEGSGQIDLGAVRASYKLQQDKFHYMAVSDKIQRVMPTNCDRDLKNNHSLKLDYGEAVLIRKPCEDTTPSLKGEVDDKYMYSIENKDQKVHGWISMDPPVGFWIITPSSEFRTGGPFKQNLASHTGPTSLVSFYNNHYIGGDLRLRIDEGEEWKMVYGPFFVHLNSVAGNEDPHKLWDRAKEQVLEEEQNWPYDFPQSEDYLKGCQRGSVNGQLQVYDQFNGSEPFPASSAWVGLAPRGEKGSWQLDTKHYQFWTQADVNGSFEIKGVVPGVYNLFASVPGVIDEFRHTSDVVVEAGSEIALGRLIYKPPRYGPTLWEIGIPDRTAAEFFVPDPDMSMVNKLFLNDTENKYRQYGLWLQYANLYPPHEDLVYNVSTSDYKKDWFYAHVTRVIGKDEDGNFTYESTTRQIIFDLEQVIPDSEYMLQIALASSNYAGLQVWVNDHYGNRPNFLTSLEGRDNAIARHGIHGIYRLLTIPIGSSLLRPGMNVIYLTQPRGMAEFLGFLYDYIRLEGPSDM